MKAPAMTRDNPVKPSEGGWIAKPVAPEETFFLDVNVVRPDGLAVGVAVQNGDITPEEAMATGLLFAAAPELLEAAQAYLRWCEKSLGAGPVGNPRTHLWHNEQIRAAILKATGAPR